MKGYDATITLTSIITRNGSKYLTEDNLNLIEACRKGDSKAFRKLVELYRDRIYGFAYQLTGHSEDARDIAQEVFIRVHKHLNSYKPEFAFTTWLYRITLNLTRDYFRSESRHRHEDLSTMEALIYSSEDNDGPSRDLEGKEIREKIFDLLDNLSPNQRTVFVMRDYHDVPVEEIATAMNSSPSTIRVHLAQARLRLKEAILKKYPEFIGGHTR